MIGLVDFDRIQEILLLVVPGFVSLKVWMLINPSQRLRLSSYVLDLVVYSVLNFVALSWLFAIAEEAAFLVRVAVGIAVFAVAPAAWPLLLRALLNRRFLRGRIVHPVPSSWDHFFGSLQQRQSCFVLIHLKNGNLIGGLYAGDSFASSYPEPQNLYLSEVWNVDGRGRFVSKIEGTRGVLVSEKMISYIEFYDVEFGDAGGASDEGSTGRVAAGERATGRAAVVE